MFLQMIGLPADEVNEKRKELMKRENFQPAAISS